MRFDSQCRAVPTRFPTCRQTACTALLAPEPAARERTMNRRVLTVLILTALLGQTWARPAWTAGHATASGSVLCEEPTRPTGG